MDELRNLQKELQHFVNRRVRTIFPATVNSVDESNKTCVVIDIDGVTLYDVQYRADDTEDSGLICVPAPGSTVLVGQLGLSDSDFVVLMFSSLTAVRAQAGMTRLELDEDGVLVERAGDRLSEMLSDFIDQVSQAVIITPAGNGAFSPTDITALNAIKTRINSLLK